MTKTNSRKKRKAARKRTEMAVSSLAEHKRIGKDVIPPFADLKRRMPLEPVSWSDERLPEMLWASLLIVALGRDEALRRFRRVGKAIQTRSDVDDTRSCVLSKVTLSGLAEWNDEEFADFVKAAIQDNGDIFASLTLFDALPGKPRWDEISQGCKPDLGLLKAAVARTLWHQSEESTDCRWMRVLADLLSGRVKLPFKMKEQAYEVLEYPNRGDLRKVRPWIRAHEMVLDTTIEGQQVSTWSPAFWRQANDLTQTDHAPFRPQNSTDLSTITVDQVAHIRAALAAHFYANSPNSEVNARRDSAFGIAAYAVDILLELLKLGNATGILGRMGLRSLVELTIHLTRLADRDDPQLWQKFRDYGYGQAKLTYLKMLETETLPSFVSVEYLESVSNEDIWHEFREIRVGNWDDSDLRKMSESIGIKNDVYDRYYDWSSAFVHGNWAALRDAEYSLCLNPLHRLHRVLSDSENALPDVVHDCVILVNRILDALAKLYPGIDQRLTTATTKLS